MGLFTSARFDNLEELFHDQLRDLYDSEQRLTEALPKMADAASSSDLRQAFEHHLHETEGHVHRLERVFEMIGKDADGKTCEAMKGLLSEGEEITDAKGDATVRDAAIIAAAQRVEHYEIASYGTARTFAQQLGLDEAARLLQQTLDEEGATDKKLTHLAVEKINVKATRR